MKQIVRLTWACTLLLALPFSARAETALSGGGRGGPFIEYHAASLALFDPAMTGNPVVIGGTGFGYVTKTLRLGGTGGGGFIWNPSDNMHFALGYGGAIAEYVITNWLTGRLLIGGGGYAVDKVISETDTTRTLQKISSGGFLVFQPSLSAEIPVHNWLNLGFSVGYFLPNVAKLQSLTLGFNVMFGKI